MYPRLTGCALRGAESPLLYNFVTDTVYDLDEEAFETLGYFTGANSLEDIYILTGNPSGVDDAVVYLQQEALVEDSHDPAAPRTFDVMDNPAPSLRYLQFHITERCNLDCGHCYLGAKKGGDMPLDLIKKVIADFSGFGFRLMITGGEPLLHPDIWDILEFASRMPVRVEVLTNGTLITPEVAERLARCVHGIQISLDGMEAGHNTLRGDACFEKTLEGIKDASRHLPVTVATMIHSKNLGEFDAMAALLEEIGVREWDLDVPSPRGNLGPGAGIVPDLGEAARVYGEYGFTEGSHVGSGDYTCGTHLCSVDVKGNVTKCGFFDDTAGTVGNENLMDIWRRLITTHLPRVGELECSDCEFIMECKGGCRYRASLEGSFYGRDPFMCRLYGVTSGGEPR